MRAILDSVMKSKPSLAPLIETSSRILCRCVKFYMKKRNLEESIKNLNLQGRKIREIKEELNCSYSTIAYHLYEKTKLNTKKRTNKNRIGKNYHNTIKGVLSNRFNQFFRIGKSRKINFDKTFTIKQFEEKFYNSPVCYLTGANLLEIDPKFISVDHITPLSRGGDCSLENLGFCTRDANLAKSDKTPEEFLNLCKLVIQNTT